MVEDDNQNEGSKRRGCKVGIIYISLWVFSLLLGVGFFFITVGLSYFGRALLLVYWPPAWSFLFKALGYDEGSELPKKPMTTGRVVYIAFRIIFSLALICFGIYILIRNGFLGQNIIYMWLME